MSHHVFFLNEVFGNIDFGNMQFETKRIMLHTSIIATSIPLCTDMSNELWSGLIRRSIVISNEVFTRRTGLPGPEAEFEPGE